MTKPNTLVERLRGLAAMMRYSGSFVVRGAEPTELCSEAASAIEQKDAEIARLTYERDQFMEQAALRDHRDRDMQEIMRINNEIIAERNRLTVERDAYQKEGWEAANTLGQALGYPWYKDDQKNFPGATEADGVCIGEHLPGTIAAEASSKIRWLTAELAEARNFIKNLPIGAPLWARELREQACFRPQNTRSAELLLWAANKFEEFAAIALLSRNEKQEG